MGTPVPTTNESGPVGELVRYFLRLGLLGFGGPVALVGQMERELVAERAWLTKEQMREAIAVCQSLPGPLAIQVGIFISYLRAGQRGAWAGGWAFILPNFLIVAAVGALYVHFSGLKPVTAIFYGVSPAVIALILHSSYRLTKLGMEDKLQWILAAICFVITVVVQAEVALLFIGAGIVGLLWYGTLAKNVRSGSTFAVALPAAAATSSLPVSSTSAIGKLLLFFLKAGALTFGSGLVIVPFLQQGVVQEYGWLTEHDFLVAVAVGMISPGPVVITATFVGYLVAGFWGALAATVGIFLPSFVLVLLAAPLLARHRTNPNVQGFIKGAYAAAIGTILGACVLLGRIAIGDWFTTLIALASLAALFRWKISNPALMAVTAVAGMVAYPLLQPTWVMAASTSDPVPLTVESRIELREVQGRIDHLAIDLKRQRLYVAELGNDSVGEVDLKEGRVEQTLRGLREPQGIGYEPTTDTLYVANGKDGSVRLYQGADLTPLGSIDLGDDADNVRIEEAAHRVWVGYGSGSLAAIDATTRRKVADIPMPAHPESFRLDPSGPQIFVNLPRARQIAVVDRNADKQVATWKTDLLLANFPLVLDDTGQILSVFRLPARLAVFRKQDGQRLQVLDTCGDSDDLFFDPKRHRVYVTCGAGTIDVFSHEPGGYEHVGSLTTSSGARTSLFVPELDRLYLAVRATSSTPAAIWVIRPEP